MNGYIGWNREINNFCVAFLCILLGSHLVFYNCIVFICKKKTMSKGKNAASCSTGIRMEGRTSWYLEYLLPQKLDIYLDFHSVWGFLIKNLNTLNYNYDSILRSMTDRLRVGFGMIRARL